MRPRQRGLQGGAAAVAGQFDEFAAQRLHLRRPVQPEQPAQVGGPDPGRAFGARLAQQREEQQHQQRRAQPVEAVTQPPVGRLERLDQPGGRERGQDQQQPGQRQVRASVNTTGA